MKNVFLMMLVLSVALFTTACKKDPKTLMVGTWQMESVEGEELSDTEKSISIEFTKDGKFEQKAGEMSRKGTFEVSKDGKTITLKPEEGKEEKMNAVEVKDGKMTFKDGERSEKITLKKK
ncbi:MAG: lipocalin family protein [Microscillaceae bacterium]|nr:lipocalin family protein [Microscillaceae bacterium]